MYTFILLLITLYIFSNVNSKQDIDCIFPLIYWHYCNVFQSTHHYKAAESGIYVNLYLLKAIIVFVNLNCARVCFYSRDEKLLHRCHIGKLQVQNFRVTRK